MERYPRKHNPYALGMRTKIRGGSLKDSPYSLGSEGHKAWLAGWKKASMDYCFGGRA